MKQHLIENLGLQGVDEKIKPASNADMVRIENEFNVKLPNEYRDFLQDFGASLFSKDVVFKPIELSAWAIDGLECFDLFYGVSEDDGFDIIAINARLKGDIPGGTIAIGHDPGSNLILLSLESGAILFFDRDSGKTNLVAHSFEAFLKSFRAR